MNIRVVSPTISRFVLRTYNRLLVDIREKTGLDLIVPPDLCMQFLLTEGPRLDKQLLQWIELERSQDHLPAFPLWLQPLMDLFVQTDSPEVLGALRQCLVFCYKIELPIDDAQHRAAEAAFIDTDEDTCGIWEATFQKWKGDLKVPRCLRLAKVAVSQVIARCNFLDIEPAHGPGAVYPPYDPCVRSDFKSSYPRITQFYPLDQYYMGLPSFWDDLLMVPCADDLGDSIVAKLTAVPKDSRGPRIICVHPREAIWIQQGQRRVLEHAITHHPLTRSAIRFNDQSYNGCAALHGSKDRSLTTIDLNEASDRVSCDLVRYLVGDYLYEILSCARADSVQTKYNGKIKLRKWATMGNCLCFPIESLVFWSIVYGSIQEQVGTRVPIQDLFVFGDDIIVPTVHYDAAVRGLCCAGLKVNTSKTFRNGFFRESCGVDAYRGVDITPLRLKVPELSSLAMVHAACDLAKRARLRGLESLATGLYNDIRDVLRAEGYHLAKLNDPDASGIYEYVEMSMAMLAKVERSFKYNRKTHASMVRILTAKATKVRPTGNWYSLQDSLLRLSRKGDNDESDRGLAYAAPNRQRYKFGWSRALL